METTAARPSRYSTPRKYLRWDATEHLKVLKMLAWVINMHEHPGIDGLWHRTQQVCPTIIEAVLGERDVTLQRICDDTIAQQGAPITPQKLMQRADKTERYDEANEYWDRVENAFLSLRG